MTPNTPIATRDSVDNSPGKLVPPGQPTIGHRTVVIVGTVALVVTAAAIIVAGQSGRPSLDSGVGSATWLLALISAAATVAYLVVCAALHVLPTGFNPVHHAVSDYGVGRYAPLFRAGLYASSGAVLALAFALISGVGSPPLAARDLLYLLLIPLTRVGMSLFPTSLEGQKVSRTGLLHYVFAIAAFTLTYLAISRITPVLLGLDPAQWLHGPLRWTAWAVAPELGLVLITMIRPLRKIFGLFERLFLLTTNVWFILVAVLLLGGAS